MQVNIIRDEVEGGGGLGLYLLGVSASLLGTNAISVEYFTQTTVLRIPVHLVS